MLFQQWIEPWENKAVLEELGIRSSEQPQMVVFHLDQHDQHDQIAIASLSLVDTSEEKARSRLLQACDTVRKSITAMIPETVSDEQAVFNVVARALGERRERDVFRRLWEIWSELKKLKP
jgi:Holliday junction resolvasome RuvABC endonuclease subunit